MSNSYGETEAGSGWSLGQEQDDERQQELKAVEGIAAERAIQRTINLDCSRPSPWCCSSWRRRVYINLAADNADRPTVGRRTANGHDALLCGCWELKRQQRRKSGKSGRRKRRSVGRLVGWLVSWLVGWLGDGSLYVRAERL